MYKFNNAAYKSLIDDLLGDAFYLEGRSLRGKISTLRQYAEIVVKRIINFPEGDHFTLGQKSVKSLLKNKNDQRLVDTVDLINDLGSTNTHTEFLGEPTNNDLSRIIDALFYLYSYMLIEYFEKYRFSDNPKINSAFSRLPPIIRYITLDSLYSKDPDNINVIDKLALAIIKAFDEQKALKWVNERKEVLEKTPSVSENAIPSIIEKFGIEIAKDIIDDAPNMYRLCIDKINNVKKQIDKHGKLYNDFEGAINYYMNFGVVDGVSTEVIEFNSILEFLYLGRKSK